MTTLGLQYLNMKETQRSNLVREAETNRANLVNEARNQAQLNELIRANMAGEALKRGSLDEQIRTDKANEAIKQGSLAETIRSNQANEAIKDYQAREAARHNLEEEGLTQQNLTIMHEHNLISDEVAQRGLELKAFQSAVNAIPEKYGIARAIAGGVLLAEFAGNTATLGNLSQALQTATNDGDFTKLHSWVKAVAKNAATIIPPGWNNAEAQALRTLLQELSSNLDSGEPIDVNELKILESFLNSKAKDISNGLNKEAEKIGNTYVGKKVTEGMRVMQDLLNQIENDYGEIPQLSFY